METIINGEITHHNSYDLLTWEHPLTGEVMSAQGEFYFNESLNRYEHEVVNENDEVLYTVIA